MLGWFNVIGLSLLAAHAITVAWTRPGRATTLRLAAAQAAGIVAVAPLLLLARTQRSAVGESPPVSFGTPVAFFSWLLFPGQDTLLSSLEQAMRTAGLQSSRHFRIRGIEITLETRPMDGTAKRTV